MSFANLELMCRGIEGNLSLTTPDICGAFGLMDGHPWGQTAQDTEVTYYPCLHDIAKQESPTAILEIGTAFGMSAAALLLAASPPLTTFISVDLGIYGKQLGMPMNNVKFAEAHIHHWGPHNGILPKRVHFFQANTQPQGGDNNDAGLDVPRWYTVPSLLRLLQSRRFDILFVDGKHTGDGLINDLRSFWPFVRAGGLVLCDDLHNPRDYAGRFPWVPATWQSFHDFVNDPEFQPWIVDNYIWNYPSVRPGQKGGLRPFGLLRKGAKGGQNPSPKFPTFDNPNALYINEARLDHIASLGLDLYGKSVLEVGCGVGRLTGFFERLGCRVVSVDGREANLAENLRRHPWRRGRIKVVDLDERGELSRLMPADIVFCYGTLYHLQHPAQAIAEMATLCTELMLVETCVQPDEGRGIVTHPENVANPNQSLHGVGTLPTRQWVFDELSKHFSYVYTPLSQPNHPEFPLEWNGNFNGNTRAIFLASRIPLSNQRITNSVLNTQYQLDAA